MTEKVTEKSKQELKKLKNSLSDVEARQIAAQRKFQELKENTPRFKIGLTLDAFRKNVRTHKINVRKVLNYIRQTKLQISRLEYEISSGQIKQEIAPGLLMTPEEVQMEIDLKLNLLDRELEQLRRELWELAQLVGLTDVMRNVIISEEEYNQYIEDVETELKSEGLELFAI